MAIDILNPIDIISALFGSIWLFIAFAMIGYLYVSARYKLNIQLTSLGLLAMVLCGFIIQAGLITWIPFVIVFIGLFGGYVIWRWIATK